MKIESYAKKEKRKLKMEIKDKKGSNGQEKGRERRLMERK